MDLWAMPHRVHNYKDVVWQGLIAGKPAPTFEGTHTSRVGAGLPAMAACQAPDFPGVIHIIPLATARSWHNPSTTRRSALSIRLQRVISSTLRWQPVQISSSSSAQMLTQGEPIGVISVSMTSLVSRGAERPGQFLLRFR